MTAPQPYRALTILLFAISAIEGIAGLVLIFGSSFVLSLAPSNLILPNANFVLALLKGLGIIAIALGYLMCVAARDPVRYVGVIDVLIFILVAAAILNIYALYALHLGALYPEPYVIARATVQLITAILLLRLRPRAAAV
jgi:hypothetical protein